MTSAGRRDPWILAAALLLALVPRIPTLAQPLLEKHGFRQTWTAYTALDYHERGIDLFHPELPIFGPPFFHPQEFPLFQAIGASVMQLGAAPDLAMRIAALLCFFATAILVFGLARHVAGRTAAWTALFFFVASPFALVWSRASLIEYLATAGCVGWIWAGICFREQRTWLLFALAVVAGSLGALVKPTTALFCAIPIGLYSVAGQDTDLRAWSRARLDPRVIAVLVVPGLLATIWTASAEGYFQNKLAAAFLAPSATRDYYLDLTEFRTFWWVWAGVAFRFAYLLAGPFVVLFGAAVIAARRERTAFWSGVAIVTLLPVLVFFGGYRRHDYYMAAISPLAALLLGFGAAWLIRTMSARGRRSLASLVAAGAASFVVMFGITTDYWRPIYAPVYDADGILPAAAELGALSKSDDLVVMVGQRYDPSILYYARRKGLLITEENASEQLYATLPSQAYRIFFSFDPALDPIGIMRSWAWSGAAGPRTYEVGSQAGALERSAVLATDDRAAFDRAASGARPLDPTRPVVRCDGTGQSLAVDPAGAWLVVRADAATLISFDAREGPLPARAVYVITPAAIHGGSSVSVSCTGPGSMTIDAMIAAPPPAR